MTIPSAFDHLQTVNQQLEISVLSAHRPLRETGDEKGGFGASPDIFFLGQIDLEIRPRNPSSKSEVEIRGRVNFFLGQIDLGSPKWNAIISSFWTLSMRNLLNSDYSTIATRVNINEIHCCSFLTAVIVNECSRL